MSSGHTFVEACLAGNAILDDVDDWVERWHKTDGQPRGHSEELREYLGFSGLEYSAWAERPSLLRAIIAGREQERPFREVQSAASAALFAARSTKDSEAVKLVEWLRETGRWSETAGESC